MRPCCCSNPYDNKVIESPIEEIPESKIYLGNYCVEVNNLKELKLKIIQDFLNIVNKLECGTQPDLEFLLQEISLVDIYA